MLWHWWVEIRGHKERLRRGAPRPRPLPRFPPPPGWPCSKVQPSFSSRLSPWNFPRGGRLEGDNVPTRPCFSNALENSAASLRSSPQPSRDTPVSYFSDSETRGARLGAVCVFGRWLRLFQTNIVRDGSFTIRSEGGSDHPAPSPPSVKSRCLGLYSGQTKPGKCIR